MAEGHYDLIGPNNEIILPGVWETVIEPDWTITMHMWPMPEPKEEEGPVIDVPAVPDPAQDEKKKGKLTTYLSHAWIICLLILPKALRLHCY